MMSYLLTALRGQFARWRRDERGQALTEYGLILALIAIVVIAALAAIGDNLKTLFENIAGSL